MVLFIYPFIYLFIDHVSLVLLTSRALTKELTQA